MKLDPALAGIFNRIKNKEPIYRKVAGDIAYAVDKNFDTEGARTPNGRWKKLKHSTIKQRIRQNKWPGKILQRKGTLVKSVQQFYNNNEGGVFTNDKRAGALFFGATITRYSRQEVFTRNRSKSGKFKKGTKPGRGLKFGTSTFTIPPRNPFVLNKSDEETIERSVINYIISGKV